MVSKIFEKNATVLYTPYCNFHIEDDDKNLIEFDVLANEYKPLVYIDNSEHQIIPVTCGTGKTMNIYTSNLELNKNYYIIPSVPLEPRSTGERVFVHGITGDTFTFAVGFPDPNEMRKVDFSPEDTFKMFDIEPKGDCYVLKLLDRTQSYIRIDAYWIWNIAHHMNDYECACDSMV